MPLASYQAKIYAGLGRAAELLGDSFTLCRPTGGDLTDLTAYAIGALPAQFTNGRATGYNFLKGQNFEDLLWNILADMTGVEVGDYFVCNSTTDGSPTYFVYEKSPLSPSSAVLCNRRVTATRRGSELSTAAGGGQGGGLPSQTGGAGRYFGTSRKLPQTQNAVGETVIAKNVPVTLMAHVGRATGTGEVPADAPGPARWQVILPMSVFPFGSVHTRDILTDDLGARYMVAADGWTPIGYRLELIRTEN